MILLDNKTFYTVQKDSAPKSKIKMQKDPPQDSRAKKVGISAARLK